MKKSLAVKAGAIVMVLLVAFFAILPDMIRAEGETEQETATEMEATLLGEENTQIEEPAPAPVEESSEEPVEVVVPETPATETLPEIPATEAVPETPATEAVPEAPATEAVQEIPATEVVPTPEVPVTEVVPETEIPATEAAPVETESKVTEVETETVKVINNKKKDKLIDEIYNNVADYIVEDTVLTGYKGAGGVISIPDGVTAIADNAFYGNTSITGVNIPNSVSTIGSSAFNGCVNLESVVIPQNVTTIGVSAFANCTGLASLNLSASAGTIVQGEFYNCASLTTVTVPEGISSIAADAFGNCTNLNSISLPGSLASLDLNAFANDMNLASISVAAGNARYASHDGCLYSAGYGELILCPPGKTAVSFAGGVNTIAAGAFSGCGYVGAITLPDSVNTIATGAFSRSGVRSVTVPKTVTALGTQAGWMPDVIYGYTGSAAESWAEDNGYVFEALDGGSGGGKKPGGDDGKGDKGNKGGKGDKNDKGGNAGNGGSSTGNAGDGVASTSTVSAAITTSGDGNAKDATPKTGVEDYGMYCLFGAMLLMGAAFFAYSKKLRYEE